MIKDLKYVSPESEGINSKDILEFIRAVEYNKINLHSFIMVRNGNIVAEGYFKNFDENFKHRLYSSTKTFLAVAIGMLIDQSVFTLKTKIINYLKPYVYTDVPKEIKDITIEDCLTMSTCMRGNTVPPRDRFKWAEMYLNNAIIPRPNGIYFEYGAGANLLGAVVEGATGKTFIDVLRPLFDELGMAKDIWCVKGKEGYCWGGSGVVCTLRDYAKFGEFVLNKGKINGKQYISKSYMDKMTSPMHPSVKANNYSPIMGEGYGYFTWITPDGYALCGMGSQECFCFKKKNFMFACQADTCAPNDIADSRLYNMVKFLVYDKIGRVKKEGKDYKLLQEKLKNLNPPTYGKTYSKYEPKINGKVFELKENTMGWKWVKFDINGDNSTFTFENARGVKTIKCGMGNLVKGTFPETDYYDKQAGVPANRELDCFGAIEWVGEKQLLLRVYVVDIPLGNMFVNFAFKGDVLYVNSTAIGEFLFYDYGGIAGGKLKK